jgi:hypothetical protein
MPDTNPACRTAFRSNSEIVRHAIGTLSGITPEYCPPSPRNRVRHGAERALFKDVVFSAELHGERVSYQPVTGPT